MYIRVKLVTFLNKLTGIIEISGKIFFSAASILDSRNNYSDLTRIQIVFFCYHICSCRKIDHVFFSKCSKNVLFLKFNLKL